MDGRLLPRTFEGSGGQVCRGSYLRRLPCPLAHRLENELAPLDVYLHGRPRLELALQQVHRERVLDAALQRAFERSRAEVRVVAFRGERVARAVGEHEPDLAFGEHVTQRLGGEVDD